jgi:hypothetical protein
MDILKSKTNSQEQADTGRRSFMWKVGAGISAVIAATVPVIAKPVISSDRNLKKSVDCLSGKVAVLESEKSIRNLHRAYEDMLDRGMYSDVLNLFTDDAEVIFNGGLFKGKNRGITRLYCNHFRSGQTGRRVDPAPGFELSEEQQQEMLEVSNDGRTARARFTYSIQAGAPMDSDSVLVKMARLQGEGIRKWWEGGTYELTCLTDAGDGSWKIKRLEYRTLSRADHKAGRLYAKPISVPQFSSIYPENAAGPDKLIKSV